MEAATEAIMECKKEVNGEIVPMWTREEVDEIVVAQVNLLPLFSLNLFET